MTARYLLSTLLLSVCLSCHTDKQDNRQQNVFHINMSSGNLDATDPAFAKDLYCMWAVHMFYNTLVETDDHLQLVPSLARRWEVSPDGLRYRFYLRDDVFFHDNPAFPDGKGKKMTAADVVYSFSRIIAPETASPGAWIFNGRVDSLRPFSAINDTTLEIRLIRPFRPLPEILSMPYCSIVPREVVTRWGKDFRSHPCGTGPFQFYLWDEENVLLAHRNPKYWEKDSAGYALPYLDAVHISFINNKATEFLLFLQGKLHFVNGVDGSFKDLVLTKNGTLQPQFRSRFRMERQVYLNTEYLGFLTDKNSPLVQSSPLKNRLVRQAINFAIDRQKIVTYFRNGIGIPATDGGFIPAGMPGYDSTHSYGYHYDPAKALALLKQAGYENGKGLPVFTILCPDNYADIVNFVGSQLADVGIHLQIEIMQPNILKQQMSRSQALFFRAQWIADYPDAETYLAFFYSKYPAPPNYTRFSQPVYDRWYDASLNADDTLRRQLYRSMDSLAITEAPVVPLFYDQLLHFTQNNVAGFHSNPMNLIDLKRVSFKH